MQPRLQVGGEAGVGELGGGRAPRLQCPGSSPSTCAGCSPGMLRRPEGRWRPDAVDVLVHSPADGRGAQEGQTNVCHVPSLRALFTRSRGLEGLGTT